MSLSGDSEDEATHEQNVDNMKEELKKPKAKLETVKSLIAKTFRYRRKDFLDSPKLVRDICVTYPCFKKFQYVS